MINRWRLEKANPAAKLSPPKKQIVWYVEDTVPIEYRPYVEEGIREWNKAFEKIGFKDAIAVRWEESGRDDFDPEDTNYCTFRWITNDKGDAMSCLRANPLTGEMIDGDVVFDASFIRYWKQQYALLVGNTTAPDGEPQSTPLAIGEVVSPILASKMGYGQPQRPCAPGYRRTRQELRARWSPEVVPADQNSSRWELTKNFARGTAGFCQFQSGLQRDFGLAAIAHGRRTDGPHKPADRQRQGDGKDTQGRDQEARAQGRAARGVYRPGDQAHRDARGWPLARPAAQLQGQHDADGRPVQRHRDHPGPRAWSAASWITARSTSPPRARSRATTTRPRSAPMITGRSNMPTSRSTGDEASELKKIAARAPEHDLVYATDEDSFLNDDPYVNRWDLGSDPCQFGKDRIALATELLKDLDARVVKDGESWARTRRALRHLARAVGRRSDPGFSVRRRPVGLSRSQGR